MVSDARDIVAQKRYVMLDLLQKDLKGISGIDHSSRLGILVDDRNMHKATLLHFQQYIVQRVPWAAVSDISRHHRCSCGRAVTSLTVRDLSNDICLGDDADHRSLGIAHDHKAYVRVA